MGDLAVEQDWGESCCRDRDAEPELGAEGRFLGRAAKPGEACPGGDVSTIGGSWVMICFLREDRPRNQNAASNTSPKSLHPFLPVPVHRAEVAAGHRDRSSWGDDTVPRCKQGWRA